MIGRRERRRPAVPPSGIGPRPLAAGGEERTEEPTADRLRWARAEGMAARSAELSAACVLLLGAAAAAATARPLLSGAVDLLRRSLLDAAALDVTQVRTVTAAALRAMIAMIAPVAAVAFLAALGANLLQAGVRWSVRPVLPALRRIVPRPGRLLRAVFSADAGFEAALAIVRVAAIGGAAFLNVRAALASLLGAAGAPLAPSLALIAHLAFRIAWQSAAALLLIGAADLWWRRRRHRRALRMTRREVADERRQRDGDPGARRRFAERSRQAWGERGWPT